MRAPTPGVQATHDTPPTVEDLAAEVAKLREIVERDRALADAETAARRARVAELRGELLRLENWLGIEAYR